MRNSPRAIPLGAVYALSVFAAGFVLGAVRTLVIAPRTSDLTAVLIELPVILGLSWILLGKLARREAAFPLRVRALAGAVAFLLLIALELVLSAFITPGGVGAFIANWLTLPGGIGLAGQVAFALFPLIHPALRN